MGEELGVVNNVKCAARNCKNNVLDCQDVSFFQFPEDSVRAKIWVDNCNRIDLLDKDAVSLKTNHYVCSVHFEDSMFTSRLKNTLTHGAIPTIFMLDNDAGSFGQKGDSPKKDVEHEDSIVKEEIIDEECQKDVNTGCVVTEQEVNREHDEQLAMYDGLVHPSAISPKIEIEVENTEIKEEIISDVHQEYINEVGTVNMKTGSVEIEKVYVEEELEMDCETDTAGDIDPLGDDDQIKCEEGAGVEDNQSTNNGILGVSKADDSGKIVKLILVPSHLKAKYQEKSGKIINQDAKSEERIRKTSGESSTMDPGNLQQRMFRCHFSDLGGKINNEFVCNVCGFRAPYQKSLNMHLRRHVEGDQYKCLSCSYKADKIDELKEHISVHASFGTFKCDKCTYSVDLKASLTMHKVVVHKGTDGQVDQGVADDTVQGTVTVKQGEESFPCQFCDYRASHNSYLIRHLRKHTVERGPPCPYCKYRPLTSSSFMKHVITHMIYPCNQCDYRAARKKQIVKHKEQVHGNK